MIKNLVIRESPAFSTANLSPSSGFNVFSGASGSGKSVLMDSILAVFGLKDSNASLIEATFDDGTFRQNGTNLANNADSEQGDDDFSENLSDFLSNDEYLVLKVLKRDKIKYLLSDRSISKKRVKEIFSPYLRYINAHSSDELSPKSLLAVLDGIISNNNAKYANLLDEYAEIYKDFSQKSAELAKLESQEKNINELIEFATFEINQIKSVSPKVGEYEELLDIKKTLSQKEKILNKIESFDGVFSAFGDVLGFLESIDKNKAIFEDSINEMQAIIAQEQERLENIDYNIEEILDRLEAISKLVHKYGSIELANEHLERKESDLKYYNELSFNKDSLQKAISTLDSKLSMLTKEITAQRSKHLAYFTKRLIFYCDALMLNPPKLTLMPKERDSSGCDLLNISLENSSISTLSTGEFNRLKLAILCINMEAKRHTTLESVESIKSIKQKSTERFDIKSGIIILDEIDANLSGSESESVARILGFLAQDYQIFAISHQSHMSIFADNHYVVRKTAENSEVVLLDKEGRVGEIARMISGEHITKEAILFAQNKLKHL